LCTCWTAQKWWKVPKSDKFFVVLLMKLVVLASRWYCRFLSIGSMSIFFGFFTELPSVGQVVETFCLWRNFHSFRLAWDCFANHFMVLLFGWPPCMSSWAVVFFHLHAVTCNHLWTFKQSFVSRVEALIWFASSYSLGCLFSPCWPVFFEGFLAPSSSWFTTSKICSC